MIDFKEEIAKKIAKTIDLDYLEIEKTIEIPKEKNMGDYAYPCFRLAKVLKKSPQMIAEEIKTKIDLTDDLIEKAEVIGGYLNFYANKKTLTETVIKEFKKNLIKNKKIMENLILEKEKMLLLNIHLLILLNLFI